jgi:hypothetical protein
VRYGARSRRPLVAHLPDEQRRAGDVRCRGRTGLSAGAPESLSLTRSGPSIQLAAHSERVNSYQTSPCSLPGKCAAPKGIVRTYFIPIFSITRRDPMFIAIVQATIFSKPAVWKPQLTSDRAPSEAKPLPQASRRSLYPISPTPLPSEDRQNHPTNASLSARRAVQTSGSVPLGMRNVTFLGSVVSWSTAPPLRKCITSGSRSRSMKSVRSERVLRLSERLLVRNTSTSISSEKLKT